LLSRNARRAWNRRVLTVWAGHPAISAISWTDNSFANTGTTPITYKYSMIAGVPQGSIIVW